MTLRDVARVVRDAKAWHPATLDLLSDGFLHRRRNALAGHTDADHLAAAAAWLARAHDATGDGGVSGRYRLGHGWTSSYPETTGYIVPTMLALASDAGMPEFAERARRCVEFLASVQLPSGAFPGLEIAENRESPSIFNSAQILNGLVAWHRATKDQMVFDAAARTARWLAEEQDADGAWRKHLYGTGKVYTYMAHAGCWLAEFGEYASDRRALDAARAHLEWVLGRVDPSTGWINDCGFEDAGQERTAVTHTIAYTIWGVLMMSRILGHERGLDVARRAAHAVARRLELSRWLPGRLDASWRPAASYACLTGNAQMALIWFELHRLDADPSLVSAACKAIDLVKRAQPMRSSNPGIQGGIAGSDPVWGAYIHVALPNWAAKFFIDALLEKRRALASLSPLPHVARATPARIHANIPRSLPAGSAELAAPARARLVFIADALSHKVEQFTEAWSAWGFSPDAVVICGTRDEPRSRRIAAYARNYGLRNLARRLTGRKSRTIAVEARQGTIPWSGAPVAAYCAARGIPVVHVMSFDDASDLEQIRAQRADLFVYAGGGIIRAPLLALAPLGMVNAHMGMLPPMRGMNVAEWSAMTGVPVGCTVHLIDPGIDTGRVLLFEAVDVSRARSIDEMRQCVDAVQIAALGRVVQWVRTHSALPPAYVQEATAGRQYFEMHDDVRGVLQAWLRAGGGQATA